jgi:hypothetical protein
MITNINVVVAGDRIHADELAMLVFVAMTRNTAEIRIKCG